MAGELDIAAIEGGVRTERFPFERLSGFYVRTGGRNKEFAIDARDLVFAHSKVGQHGGEPELPVNPDAAAIQRVLEGRYRFGTRFAQPGFQHDVQWEKGKSLAKERFECAAQGPVAVSGPHANVYPSDVVTGQQVEPIK